MPFDRTLHDVLQKRLIERWDQKPYWTTLDAYDALRMAQATWQALTGYWVSRITRPLIPNDAFLPTPGLEQVLAVRRPDGRPVTPTTWEELSFMRPGWRADVVGAAGIPSAPTYWAPVAPTTILVWPQVAVDTYTLTIDGLGLTPQASIDDGQEAVDLPDELSSLLVDLGSWWGAGKAGTAEQDRHQPGLDRFLAAVNEQLRLHGAADPHWVLMEAVRQRLNSPAAEAPEAEA